MGCLQQLEMAEADVRLMVTALLPTEQQPELLQETTSVPAPPDTPLSPARTGVFAPSCYPARHRRSLSSRALSQDKSDPGFDVRRAGTEEGRRRRWRRAPPSRGRRRQSRAIEPSSVYLCLLLCVAKTWGWRRRSLLSCCVRQRRGRGGCRSSEVGGGEAARATSGDGGDRSSTL